MRPALFVVALFFAAAVTAAPAFAADPEIERRATEIVQLRDHTPEQAKMVIERLTDSEKATLVQEQDTIDRLLAVTPDPKAMTSKDRKTLRHSTKIIEKLIQGELSPADRRACNQQSRVGSRLVGGDCRN